MSRIHLILLQPDHQTERCRIRSNKRHFSTCFHWCSNLILTLLFLFVESGLSDIFMSLNFVTMARKLTGYVRCMYVNLWTYVMCGEHTGRRLGCMKMIVSQLVTNSWWIISNGGDSIYTYIIYTDSASVLSLFFFNVRCVADVFVQTTVVALKQFYKRLEALTANQQLLWQPS